jgi:hypothetical protein
LTVSKAFATEDSSRGGVPKANIRRCHAPTSRGVDETTISPGRPKPRCLGKDAFAPGEPAASEWQEMAVPSCCLESYALALLT